MGTMTSARDRLVLGIDPSFNRSGWALLDASHHRARLLDAALIVPKGADRPSQLLSIQQQFDGIVEGKEGVSAYFERPGAWQRKGGTRRETVEALSMSRAVMLLVCALRAVAAHDVDVHVVRRAMFGRG